ncbi:MAG: YcxB family protein [Gammaproteobacteria bacterium]|nr:YcxB family protein [Gammaproteobacteria bacterium]
MYNYSLKKEHFNDMKKTLSYLYIMPYFTYIMILSILSLIAGFLRVMFKDSKILLITFIAVGIMFIIGVLAFLLIVYRVIKIIKYNLNEFFKGDLDEVSYSVEFTDKEIIVNNLTRNSKAIISYDNIKKYIYTEDYVYVLLNDKRFALLGSTDEIVNELNNRVHK